MASHKRLKNAISKLGFKYEHRYDNDQQQEWYAIWLDHMPAQRRMQILRECFAGCRSDDELVMTAAHYAARIQRKWLIVLEAEFKNEVGEVDNITTEIETQENVLISKLQDFCTEEIECLVSEIVEPDVFIGINWTAKPLMLEKENDTN